jgi:hypothetical protein
MIAKTAHRVTDHTNPSVNERIRTETERRVAYFEVHPEEIDRRLRELDAEWDIERTLATGSSTLTLTGLLLSFGVSRKWLLLSLGVQAFYMQHALQGWCPPLPVFRQMGIRTTDEINYERIALKALRGDFRDTPNAGAALSAARES